jgi:hypothetical protein
VNNRDITVYQYGTTIRFEAEFFDFDGEPVDPDQVALKIYDHKYNEITSEVGIPNGGVGKYYYDYETERKEARLYYEWYAMIDGKPSLRRGEFMTRFVR